MLLARQIRKKPELYPGLQPLIGIHEVMLMPQFNKRRTQGQQHEYRLDFDC